MSLGLVSYGSSDDEGSEEEDVPEKLATPEAPAFLDDDEFGFDEEFSVNSSSTLKLPPPKVAVNNSSSSSASEKVERLPVDSQHQLQFSVIPKPSSDVRNSTADVEAEPELIIQAPAAELALREKPPPKRKTVKIAALAFSTVDSDSDDEGVTSSKLYKPAEIQGKEKKTGLFAVLPPPKTSSQLFVPKAVSAGKPAQKMPISKHSASMVRKPQPTAAGSAVRNPAFIKSTSGRSLEPMKPSNSGKARPIGNGEAGESSEEEDEGPVNFFSIGDDVSLPLITESDGGSDAALEQYDALASRESRTVSSENGGCSSGWDNGIPSGSGSGATVVEGWSEWGYGESSSHQSGNGSGSEEAWSSEYTHPGSGSVVSEDPPLVNIHDEQFLRLQGRKNRGKEINIRDIRALEAPSALELTKNMTRDEEMMPAHNNKDLPTSQQRRKHQITYLAHQAKEREFQLKNQWAENRTAKRQAQSKYGF